MTNTPQTKKSRKAAAQRRPPRPTPQRALWAVQGGARPDALLLRSRRRGRAPHCAPCSSTALQVLAGAIRHKREKGIQIGKEETQLCCQDRVWRKQSPQKSVPNVAGHDTDKHQVCFPTLTIQKGNSTIPYTRVSKRKTVGISQKGKILVQTTECS